MSIKKLILLMACLSTTTYATSLSPEEDAPNWVLKCSSQEVCIALEKNYYCPAFRTYCHNQLCLTKDNVVVKNGQEGTCRTPDRADCMMNATESTCAENFVCKPYFDAKLDFDGSCTYTDEDNKELSPHYVQGEVAKGETCVEDSNERSERCAGPQGPTMLQCKNVNDEFKCMPIITNCTRQARIYTENTLHNQCNSCFNSDPPCNGMYVCVNDEGNLVNNDKVEKGTCQPPEDGKVPDGAVCEDRSNQNTKNFHDQYWSKDPSTKWTNNPSTKCANVLSVCSEIDGKFTCVAAKTDGGCTTEKNFCPGGGIRGKDKDCNLDACPLDNQPLSDDSSKSLDFNVYLMVFTGVLAVF